MSEGSPAVERDASRPGTVHPESSRLVRARFAFVFVAFLVLIGLAHGGAELKVWLASGHPGPSVVYYRALLAYCVATILLTLALGFYLFSRRGAPNSYWRAFWTFGYLAYLCHIGWRAFGTIHGDLSGAQEETVDLGKAVSRLGPDFILTLWWGLDVVLAWVICSDRKWVQLQRGALHLFAFAIFFGATVLALIRCSTFSTSRASTSSTSSSVGTSCRRSWQLPIWGRFARCCAPGTCTILPTSW